MNEDENCVRAVKEKQRKVYEQYVLKRILQIIEEHGDEFTMFPLKIRCGIISEPLIWEIICCKLNALMYDHENLLG